MRKRQEAVRAALLAAVMPSKGDGAGTLTPFDHIAPTGNCGNSTRE